MPPRARLDFDGGGMMTAADFAREQAYHLETQAIRCRALHTSGIARGLVVQAIDGGRGIVVAPGTAIDGRGRAIVLAGAVDLDLRDRLESTLVLSIGLRERFADWRVYPRASGYRRRKDETVLILTVAPKVPDDAIVLAKLVLRPAGRLAAIDVSPRISCGLGVGRIDMTPPDGAGPVPAFAMADDETLAITSARTDVFGDMALDGTLSVGAVAPDDRARDAATLTIRAGKPKAGAGRISSKGAYLFGLHADDLASLVPGDLLEVRAASGDAPPDSLTVASVAGPAVAVTTNPPAVADALYRIARGTLVRVRTGTRAIALQISTAGAIGLGGPPSEARLAVHDGDILLDAGRRLSFGGDGSVTASPDGRSRAIAFHASANVLEMRETGAIAFLTATNGVPLQRLVLTPEQNVGLGVDAPSQRLSVDGTIRASGGIVFPDHSHQTFGVSAIPIGTIVNWWRPDAASAWLAEGFHVCDGSTITDAASPLVGMKTPDLRQAFIRGVVSYEAIGGTGGAATHAHAFTLAQHTHPMGHTHAVRGGTTGIDGKAGDATAGSEIAIAAHAHLIDVTSNTCSPGDTGFDAQGGPGTTETAACLPPFMTLLKAMRIK